MLSEGVSSLNLVMEINTVDNSFYINLIYVSESCLHVTTNRLASESCLHMKNDM